MTGVNQFTNNAFYDGLDIFSVGAITVSNLNAINNGTSSPFGYGTYLDNCQAYFGPSCSITSASQPITLTGSSAFKYNGLDGLDVFTNGAITLSSISANSNGGNGAYLDNGTTNFISGVALTGADFFNDNLGDGLDIISNGEIALKTIGLSANGNGTAGLGYGVNLDNAGPSAKIVSLSGTSFFDNNQDIGLAISSNGAIIAGNVTANDNVSEWGVALNNASGTASITFTGTNVFNGNGHDGLTASSNGAITLSNVTANSNGRVNIPTFTTPNVFGIWLDNSAGANQAVTLTGTSNFNNDYSGGVFVDSKGVINLADLTANNSLAGPGVTLINDTSTSKAGITLTGFERVQQQRRRWRRY